MMISFTCANRPTGVPGLPHEAPVSGVPGFTNPVFPVMRSQMLGWAVGSWRWSYLISRADPKK